MSDQPQVPPLSSEDRDLGLDRHITRRDFLNASLLGAGAALLRVPAPGGPPLQSRWHPWTGYGGVGDYARSNGNTWDVIQAAHALRDGAYDRPPADLVDTGEVFDLVICGGGFAGLGAAYYYRKAVGASPTMLMLDNHPVWGGEAKRNEFMVNGVKLIGPQGSNDFGVPQSGDRRAMWDDLGIPTSFEYQELTAGLKPLEFTRDNYYFQMWSDDFESHGFYFSEPTPHWVRNPWGHGLEGTPWPEEVRRDLLRWRTDVTRHHEADDIPQWLDTMTYEQYLVNVMGLKPEVARYADPILAGAIGLGSDVISAYSAYQISLPGFQGLLPPDRRRSNRLADSPTNSFPGGNDGSARFFLKWLVPEAIEGDRSFAAVHNGRIRFDALDRRGAANRIRLAATAVRVEPEGLGDGRRVAVTYVQDGRSYRVHARSVVMATGGWAAKHAVRGLPEDHQAAFEALPKSPMLVVNVALNNWRAMYRLGFTAATWRGGFGFCCNLRPNMIVGDYQPELHPDKPNLLTFYVPFHQAGLPLVEQGNRGRAELLGTSYADYERQIRRQLATLFGDAGLDPARDIAGVILNRWGHAYVDPAPGFYFGTNGKPAPRDVIRRPFGRIAFAHSELNGHQNASAAVAEGRRAVEQVAAAG